MTLETIMQILYANKMTDVIVLATRIDNNVPDYNEKSVGSNITVRISKEDLTKLGLKPKEEKDREYWFNVSLPVVAVNKYMLKEKYLVNIGEHPKWVDEEDSKYSTSVEPIGTAIPNEPLVQVI